MEKPKPCPCCGSGEVKVLLGKEFYMAGKAVFFTTVKCELCGLAIEHTNTFAADNYAQNNKALRNAAIKKTLDAWNTRYERTCHCGGEYEDGPFWVNEYSFDCGHKAVVYGRQPRYCPYCGAKVV